MLEVKIARVFDRLSISRATRLAVAVSGGADSVALLSLATKWAKSGAPRDAAGFNGSTPGDPIAFVVDHRLRKESADEAKFACETAEQLGVPARLFKLEHDEHWPPVDKRDLLNLARQHRYNVLFRECCSHGAPVLLTGHHSGDQAENFLIRLSRASGIDGLAGIGQQSFLSLGGASPQVQLVRPLLGVSKMELQDYCRQEGLAWVEDPTNRDTSYLRNLLRARIASDGYQTSQDSLQENDTGVNGIAGTKPGAANLTTDILLLSKVCSAAKEKLQQSSDSLLREVVGPLLREQPSAEDSVGHRINEKCQITFTRQALGSIPPADQSPFASPQAFKAMKRYTGAAYRIAYLPPMATTSQGQALRLLARLFQTKTGLPPKTATLLQAWRHVRTGALRSPHGKIPKKVDLQGCFLLPVPRTDGRLIIVAFR